MIREAERDALRFFWVNNLENKRTEVYRVTRALFGLGSSPFLLGGTLQQHFEMFKERYPDCITELKNETYVDDINIGACTKKETERMKQEAVDIFKDGGFSLDTWHSNVPELEGELTGVSDQTFAKESLGTRHSEVRLLGLLWDKAEDSLAVVFPQSEDLRTKRVVLRTIAKIYDPLGIVSPVVLIAKIIFRELCDRKISWDQPLPSDLEKRWQVWLKNLPSERKVPRAIPRAIPSKRENITSIELHGFSDASGQGCSAVIYAVVKQERNTKQGILVSKSQLAKRDLTIPRLKLFSCHMVAHLLANTIKALEQFEIAGKYAWTDSSVCLYWIQGDGAYKQFVTNRVRKITEKGFEWRHVPTSDNPADIGSRGSTSVRQNDKWMVGPPWLSVPAQWPLEIVPQRSEKSETEAKLVKEIMSVSIGRKLDEIDLLITKSRFWKTVRILS